MKSHHLTGVGYLATYVALLVLATISLLISFVHWGTADLVISMVVASIKAVLVLWFFMHLYEQRFANRLVMLISFVLLGVLIALISIDVATRHTFPPAARPSANDYRR